MLHDPDRHEPLCEAAWDAERAREVIAHVVRDTEARFDPDRYWPLHPLDVAEGDAAPAYPLYHGACGVLWALHYLESTGAVTLARHYAPWVPPLVARNAAWLATIDGASDASYLMGETGILLLAQALEPTTATAERLAELIESNLDNPARELMWGAPGTLLAALLLHERSGEGRWADAFRVTARKLWSELVWSPEFRCRYWTQEMYGRVSSYLDAVHGFVATASPLIRGRHLLDSDEWSRWSKCIAETVRKTATRDGDVMWITRARAFAMHAIGQAADHERRYRQIRYSLWTGDLGVAIYLWDCIRAGAAFPTLDVFFAEEVPSAGA